MVLVPATSRGGITKTGVPRQGEEGVVAVADAEIEAAVGRAEALDVWEPAGIVDGMYAEPTAPLSRQRAELLRDLGAP